jgi:hypothetical protein
MVTCMDVPVEKERVATTTCGWPTSASNKNMASNKNRPSNKKNSIDTTSRLITVLVFILVFDSA